MPQGGLGFTSHARGRDARFRCVTATGPTEPPTDVSTRRWIWGAATAALVLAATYALAVLTPGGQALENAALRGADQVREAVLTEASVALGHITVATLALATALVGVIGVARRRWDLAIAGVSVIILGQLITQSLKRFVPPRPELVTVTGDSTNNSFPSGHTTIAMTMLFAALIVTPYRWRGLMLLLTLGWAVGIGAYTITAKWHRFSDTLGAGAVAFLCASLAAWWLTRRGSVARYGSPPRRARVVIAVLLAGAGVVRPFSARSSGSFPLLEASTTPSQTPQPITPHTSEPTASPPAALLWPPSHSGGYGESSKHRPPARSDHRNTPHHQQPDRRSLRAASSWCALADQAGSLLGGRPSIRPGTHSRPSTVMPAGYAERMPRTQPLCRTRLPNRVSIRPYVSAGLRGAGIDRPTNDRFRRARRCRC